jgi:hypothetical protein
VTISDETFAELMDANRASLAEKATGIPAYRIRYLARTDQIDNKKLGKNKILVRLVDLEPYKK